MRLFEHPDFEQALLAAEAHFRARGLRAAVIEKDYYVTEALRTVAQFAGEKVIFKGGTSLSKGWNLVQRFSEDIDLFLDPEAFAPPLGTKAIDRELKRLRDAVSSHPGLTFLPAESQTIGGAGRSDRFEYGRRLGHAGDLSNRVLLEVGTASGREPTEIVSLRSYLSEFLEARGTSLGAEDEQPFPFRLLHFRRTFVEKLFAIHGKIELLKQRSQPLGSYARHYYDLAQLAIRPEVVEMLESDEYGRIKADYDLVSQRAFPRDYRRPEGMSFASSEALFPRASLASSIAEEYERQCRLLCYGEFPSWREVQQRFAALRDRL